MTHEEAIKIVRNICQTDAEKEALATLIPELAESEDERMMREIIRYIREQGKKPTGLPNGSVAVADMLAWLEKQKEREMPDSTGLIELWDKEKAMLREKDFRSDEWRLAQNAFLDGFARGYGIKQKKQRSAEWSEEELAEFEEELATVIGFAISQSQTEPHTKMSDFVKCWSPRLLTLARKRIETETKEPKSHWKPSEEQMKALDNFIYCKSPDTDKYGDAIQSLYCELKKLM